MTSQATSAACVEPSGGRVVALHAMSVACVGPYRDEQPDEKKGTQHQGRLQLQHLYRVMSSHTMSVACVDPCHCKAESEGVVVEQGGPCGQSIRAPASLLWIVGEHVPAGDDATDTGIGTYVHYPGISQAVRIHTSPPASCCRRGNPPRWLAIMQLN